MGGTGRLRMSREAAGQIVRHAQESYPHECCGALLGRETGGEGQAAREIVRALPLVNRQEAPRHRFLLEAGDVLEAERTARAAQCEVLGWYHSHPDSPARPSEYDREHAWPWYSYVIVSVAAGVAGEIRSWRLAEDRAGFLPEAIAED